MTIITPALKRQCEAGIRAIYKDDPRRAEHEVRQFQLICAIDDRPRTRRAARLVEAVKRTLGWTKLFASKRRAVL